MHGAEQFGWTAAVVGRRHAFLGGAEERIGIFLPADQNGLLVFRGEAGAPSTSFGA